MESNEKNGKFPENKREIVEPPETIARRLAQSRERIGKRLADSESAIEQSKRLVGPRLKDEFL